MRRLCALPRPTVALVHGACYGGGVGLVACCDVAIATRSASFALTEVRWGVIPAPIVPQLCAAMGVRSLRRYGDHRRALHGARGPAHRADPRDLPRRRPRRGRGADRRCAAAERARGGRPIEAAPARAGGSPALRSSGSGPSRSRPRSNAPRPRRPKACRASSRSAGRPGTSQARPVAHPRTASGRLRYCGRREAPMPCGSLCRQTAASRLAAPLLSISASSRRSWRSSGGRRSSGAHCSRSSRQARRRRVT